MIYKISKEMREILIELLTNNIVVTSWGITHLNISDAEISFEVDGFKYKDNSKIAIYKMSLK